LYIFFKASDAKSEVKLDCGHKSEEEAIKVTHSTTQDTHLIVSSSHLTQLTTKMPVSTIVTTTFKTTNNNLFTLSKTTRLTQGNHIIDKNYTKPFSFSYKPQLNTSNARTTQNNNKTTNTTSARQNLLQKLNSENNFLFEIDTQNNTHLPDEDIVYYDDQTTAVIEVNEALINDMNISRLN
jgi:hypothetical protein